MKDYYTEKPGRHLHMIDSLTMIGWPEYGKEDDKPKGAFKPNADL